MGDQGAPYGIEQYPPDLDIWLFETEAQEAKSQLKHRPWNGRQTNPSLLSKKRLTLSTDEKQRPGGESSKTCWRALCISITVIVNVL